jgi:hypothetical protein
VLDVRAVRVFAVHAALGLAGHALERCLYVKEAALLARILPDTVRAECRGLALSVDLHLLSPEPKAHADRQREAVDSSHAALQFLLGLELLKLTIFLFLLRRQLSPGASLAPILRKLGPRVDGTR